MSQTIHDYINKLEHQPLTPEQLQQAASSLYFNGEQPRLKTEIYDNLRTIGSLDELFEGRYDACILLYQIHGDNGNNVGHFIVIIRKNAEEYTYFDSYALGIEELLHRTHEKGYIKKLIQNKSVDVNHKRLQSFKDETSTCGLHCVFRSLFWKMTNQQYESFLAPYLTKFTGDELVTLAVRWAIK